jgi:hypothetical protein
MWKGLDHDNNLNMLLIANLVSAILLVVAWFRPSWARVAFIVLFGWASWKNWTTVRDEPALYMEYADLTWSSLYARFIQGWFAEHTKTVVSLIAFSQLLIATGISWKGRVFQLACGGGILFLLAIAPLGTGSGFPCSVLLAIALGRVLFHEHLHESTLFSMHQKLKS